MYCGAKEWSLRHRHSLSTKWNYIFSGFEWILMTFGLWCGQMYMYCTRTHISSKEKRSQEMNAFTELDSSLNCPYEAAFVHDLWPSVLFSFLIFCCKQLPLTLRNDTRYLRKAKFYFRSFFCTIPHSLSSRSNCNENHFFSLVWPFFSLVCLFYLFSLFCQQDIYLRRANCYSYVIYHRKPQIKFKRCNCKESMFINPCIYKYTYVQVFCSVVRRRSNT